MSDFLHKICPELLKVRELDNKDITKKCVVYAKDYKKLVSQIKQRNCVFYEYPFINAIGISLTQDEIFNFAKTTIVSFIAKQTKVSTQINVAKKILNVEKLYSNKYDGNNVTIAIIDTGVNPHLDFVMPVNRIIKFVDLINKYDNPYDDNGHGTFVTSIACGNGLVSNSKFAGVSPKSNIVSIKALEQNGETGAYKILEGMQWISDNYKKYNIKVVCMSFGSNPLGRNDPLVVGAERLWDMGLVVVAAAGNSGPELSSIKSPGYSNKIITVGGLNDNRTDDEIYNTEKFTLADFSSRGPAGLYFKPDLLAPAVNISGAQFNIDNGTFYIKMSGTSVATPMIAGICALIISNNPNMSPDRIKMKLIKNCYKLGKNRNEEGFGFLNLTRYFN